MRWQLGIIDKEHAAPFESACVLCNLQIAGAPNDKQTHRASHVPAGFGFVPGSKLIDCRQTPIREGDENNDQNRRHARRGNLKSLATFVCREYFSVP